MHKKSKFAGFSYCDKPQSNGGICRPMLDGQDTTAGKLQKVTIRGRMCGKAMAAPQRPPPQRGGVGGGGNPGSSREAKARREGGKESRAVGRVGRPSRRNPPASKKNVATSHLLPAGYGPAK
jgi:hypothetical protein